MGFFDKLKRGLEELPQKEEKEPKQKISRKPKAGKVKIEPEPQKKAAPSGRASLSESKREEPPSEGELAIDVYETEGEFVIQSTIAGIKPEDLDITVENDMVTIRGSRTKEIEEVGKKYYYQECYWGSFSRQVILPEEVDDSKAEATIKNGVLTLRVPKVRKIQKRKITVKQEE